MLKINGENVDAAQAAGMTLTEYLEKNGYKTGRIAVERNLEIVPKSEYDSVVLEDGDAIEIVNFVGGGQK